MDDFKGIEGKKRLKQFEFTVHTAMLYLCFQMMLKSIMYFLLTSIWKQNALNNAKSSEDGNISKEIELISSRDFSEHL
jgi:hypothetical protein